jgi:hypothetical protein
MSNFKNQPFYNELMFLPSGFPFGPFGAFGC